MFELGASKKRVLAPDVYNNLGYIISEFKKHQMFGLRGKESYKSH